MTLLSFSSCIDDNRNQNYSSKNESSSALIDHIEGELLFEEHCSMCHSKELDKGLTGPELGLITEYRSIDWLVDFTKYPYEMIYYGDSISLRIWNAWQPTIKGSFLNSYYGFDWHPTETKDIKDDEVDLEIRKIYDWIKYESAKQGLVDSMIHSIKQYDDYPIQSSQITSEVMSIIRNSGINGLELFSTEKKVKRLEVIVDKDIISATSFMFSLIFPDRNIAIPFIKCEDKYVLLGSQGMKKIALPSGESIFLYGERMSPGENGFMIKELVKAEGKIKVEELDFSLSLDDVNDYQFNK